MRTRSGYQEVKTTFTQWDKSSLIDIHYMYHYEKKQYFYYVQKVRKIYMIDMHSKVEYSTGTCPLLATW